MTVAHDSLPFVSVVMPVYNEGDYMRKALSALLNQTYSKDRLEIIIADGISQDHTREIIMMLSATTQVPVCVVDNPKRIAASGLNSGLEHARGNIIIRVDGHCEVEPDYVENCVELLRARKADGVGGPIETVGEGLRSRAIALAMSSTFGVGGSAFRTINDREMYTDTVAFPAYTREIIEKAGAFNEELVRNQDDEYNYRIRELGGKILLSPTIRSRYYSRSTFSSLWKQYFQYGYWKVRVLQLHPNQMRPRQFVPAIFVTLLGMLGILSCFSSVAMWGLILTVLGYLVANFGAAIYSSKATIPLIPFVSLGFLILHASYGLGWLRGLVAFRKRWRERFDMTVPGFKCS